MDTLVIIVLAVVVLAVVIGVVAFVLMRKKKPVQQQPPTQPQFTGQQQVYQPSQPAPQPQSQMVYTPPQPQSHPQQPLSDPAASAPEPQPVAQAQAAQQAPGLPSQGPTPQVDVEPRIVHTPPPRVVLEGPENAQAPTQMPATVMVAPPQRSPVIPPPAPAPAHSTQPAPSPLAVQIAEIPKPAPVYTPAQPPSPAPAPGIGAAVAGEGKHFTKKIILIGDGGVGKTTLIRKFVYDMFDDKYIQTIGTKVSKKKIVFNELNTDVNLMVWDVQGQRNDPLLTRYFAGAEGALFICDVTRSQTYENLPEWISDFHTACGKVPIILLGNKADLMDQMQFGEPELKALAARYGAAAYLTSAKSGANVEKSFMDMAREIIK